MTRFQLVPMTIVEVANSDNASTLPFHLSYVQSNVLFIKAVYRVMCC